MQVIVINPADIAGRATHPLAETSRQVPMGYAAVLTEDAVQQGIREVLAMGRTLAAA